MRRQTPTLLTAPRQGTIGPNARTLSPEQRLAAAVLWQAVADSHMPHDVRRRLGASAFLTKGGDVLRFWCDVAGLDPAVVRDKARRLNVVRGQAEAFEP